jgi:hypothetical protein
VRAALLTGLGVLGVVAGGLAWRTAHPTAVHDLSVELAHALKLPEEAVHAREARFGFPSALVVDDVTVGPFQAASVRVSVSPWSALVGRTRPERVELTDARFGQLFRAHVLDVRLGGHGRYRISGKEVAVARAGLGGVILGDVGIEVEAGEVARVAFTGTRIGRPGEAPIIDGLAGAALRDDLGWKVRAARPGLVVVGRFVDGTLAGKATLESLPLKPGSSLFARFGLQVEDAHATGALDVRSTGGYDGDLSLQGKLAFDGLRVQHKALAGRSIGPLDLSLDGAVRIGPAHAVAFDKVSVSAGPLALVLDGALTRTGTFLAQVTLHKTGCADLLRALPRDLLPALDGLVLDGHLAGRAELAGDSAHLPELALDVKLDVGCRVLGDPPLADVRALGTSLGWRGLDLAQPAWRPLPSLPTSVVRAFLVSEDGHFFSHHGFDLDMIRRALAADLVLGRIDRGASTLSQQLVKNLYLSGERTAARKLEEAVLTWRLEQLVPKRRILEYYLNLVEFGPGVYGIADAAERYFGKEPEELVANEAAQLAALLPAPRRGMDAAWQKRYRSLLQRLPSENVSIPGAPAPAVKLSQR